MDENPVKDILLKFNIGKIRFGFITILVMVLWFVLGFVMPIIFGDLTDSGLFGDGFGSVNALFSGFAFLGLFYTILLQQKQIAEQQEQFKREFEMLEKTKNFTTAHELFKEIKDDLDNFEYNESKGNNAIQELSLELVRIENEEVDGDPDDAQITVDALEYLTRQLNTLIRIIETKSFLETDRDFIVERLIYFYVGYLKKPFLTILEIDGQRIKALTLVLNDLDKKVSQIELANIFRKN